MPIDLGGDVVGFFEFAQGYLDIERFERVAGRLGVGFALAGFLIDQQ